MAALDGGVVETAAGLAPELRLASIHARVAELIDEHGPDAVALEELYFGQNARSAFAVGQARGVAMLAAAQRGLPCRSYTPQQVKASVCGHGGASKEQVAKVVAMLLALPQPPEPSHAADALAVAICHLNGAPMARALAVAT
jgi:crossover junction endodeoxyribonuclease RuvC